MDILTLITPALGFVDPVPGGQMPPMASSVAKDTDFVYYYTFWVSMFFLVLITALLVWFPIKYRRKSNSEPMGEGPTHHTGLEVTWSVIPFFLVAYMFWIGVVQYEVMATPPSDAYRVDVQGKQWLWEYTYMNGITGTEMHTYVGQPFSLRLDSSDVLHSWYCPSMRVKRDVVPGRTEWVWFEPIVPKENENKPFPHEYMVFCAEYCGTDHSRMTNPLFVHENEEAFLAALDKMDTLEIEQLTELEVTDGQRWKAGLVLVQRKGCLSCHTLDGNEIVSYPSWLELSQNWGGQKLLKGGKSVKIDKNYIRNAILNPQAEIVEGYGPLMPRSNFKKKREEYIITLLEKLKDLQGTPELKAECDKLGIELK